MTGGRCRVRSTLQTVLFRKRTLALALTAAVSLAACRRSAPPSIPSFLGDGRDTEVDARALDPALADAWTRLQAAWKDAPQSDAVITIADEILEQDPPAALAREALHAKAAHAYLHGQDAQAARLAQEALAWEPRPTSLTDLERSLTQLRLRALARGGDPQVALQALADPEQVARAGLERGPLSGLRAVALERNAAFPEAVAAYAAWRASVPGDSAAGLYAQARIEALGRSLPPDVLAGAAAALEPGEARLCLEALAGAVQLADDVPSWVWACAGPPARVGVLLPRTGPLSALADPQLAAASAAATSIGEAANEPFLWRDAGSSPTSAVAAARALIDDGATVLIGPIGAANVRAVQDAVGGRVPVIVPGEAVGGALGVAPSLEERTAALVRLARSRGARQIMVLAPDNGYGRRALKSIRATVGKSGEDDLVVQTYPPDTTSFQPLITPLLGGLRPGGALLVPDHLTRLESVLRQLIRLDRAPSASGKEGVMVLSTAEGASEDVLLDGRKVFAEVWIAPAAWGSDRSSSFERQYREAEGTAPGDQALLVYQAFVRALSPSASADPEASKPSVPLAHVGADGVIRTTNPSDARG